jgi:hypothetical protein
LFDFDAFFEKVDEHLGKDARLYIGGRKVTFLGTVAFVDRFGGEVILMNQ